MLLGTVISQMQDETVALDTLLALDDLVLLARVREAADAHSVALGEYVSTPSAASSTERMTRRGWR